MKNLVSAVRGSTLLHALYLLAALAIVFTIAPFFGYFFWGFELAHYFALHSALFLGVMTLLFFVIHRRRDALIALCFSFIGLVSLIPLYAPSKQPTSCAATHRLLLLNLLKENQRYEEVRNYVRTVNPEVVIFQEVTPAWDEELGQLQDERYSVWNSEPGKDHTGIAVLSKIPFIRSEIEVLGDASPPSVSAEYDLNGEQVLLIGTHPGPPYGPVAMEIKKQHIEALTEIIRRHRGPAIILGDLNMTARSALFQRFLQETGLRDSRRGFGLQPTYPVGTLSILMIPIDHALVSGEVTVLDRALGPDIGSDHFPVELEVGIECQ